jgi:hypothetical protein
MCSNSRQWHCWNSIGFDGSLLVNKLVSAITGELYQFDGFNAQFVELVRLAKQDRSGNQPERWRKLLSDEATLLSEQKNVTAAIGQYGPRPMFDEKLRELDSRERDLKWDRHQLEMLLHRELRLPQSIDELRTPLEEQFRRLAAESPEFGDLMKQLVRDIYVYSVRLLDGGHLLPRAKVRLSLAGVVPDAECVPGLHDLLTRELTLDLFRPPQRERIREEAVRLAAQGIPQRQIAARLTEEKPKLPVVQKALALDRQIQERGLESPYVLVMEPPEDYPKLRRHKNHQYCFQPREGYQRPAI